MIYLRANFNVNGKTIFADVAMDVLFNENTMRQTIDVYKTRTGKAIKKNLHKDENGMFFYWDKQKVYAKDFNYLSAEELIEHIKAARENGDWVTEETIFATLLKESDKLNVVYPLPKIDTIIPFLGISICGSKRQETVCKFTEERYKKADWYYKVSLAPIDKKMRLGVSTAHPYFSDLCQEIRRGQAELRLATTKATA